MFDKLFEFLKTVWAEVVPYYVVSEMELACVLRCGKFKKTSKSGIHFKMPFADVVYQYYVVTQTSHLTPQTLTTYDGKSIVVKAIVRFNIEDVKKYTLGVWDAHDAIGDTVQGIINSIVRNYKWEDIVSGIEDEITEKAHEALSDWGICVEKVTLSDLGEIRTIRLISNDTHVI